MVSTWRPSTLRVAIVPPLHPRPTNPAPICRHPYNTVPKVEHLFQAQLSTTASRREARSRLSLNNSPRPLRRYLRPIVADADTGHGASPRNEVDQAVRRESAAGSTSRTKLRQKSADTWRDKVLVPFGAYNLLVAIRFQYDIMGVSNLVVARTDSEAATLSPPASTLATTRHPR